ncbi:MAG: putA, partial [Paucimonas sp.]|nr:putA [Paucimonas sp.]
MDGTEPADLPFAGLASDINPDPSPLREAITAAYRIDEPTAVHSLLAHTARFPESEEAIRSLATRLIKEVRAQRVHASGVDALMHEFSLSSDEGIALMCLAEALLRIPDHATADRLIAEKIGNGDWRRHLGESPSLFVNAAAWGLMITGKLVSSNSERTLGTALTRLIGRGGEPLIRRGVELAMRMLGKQFVAGQTIEEALDHARSGMTKGYRFSFDMLGEAALTSVDAERYFAAYEHAVRTVGASAEGSTLIERPGISVKLSALHPRYSRAQRHRVMTELLPRLRHLMLLCNEYGIGLSIDAEEADRLEMSLDLIEQLALEPALRDFDGFGVVVQAYQKRAPFVIDFLADLARRRGCRFMLRLVKGAYWDTEIKRAQVEGAADYPVFTRKAHTDVSYLACAQKLLDASSFLFPQFATHNAQTLACIRIWAQERGIRAYEFQCLHGMGETLYDQLIGSDGIPCRIYAPVGSHETLLAYLVRRLLENGANTSFVNRIVDKKVPIEELIANPLDLARETAGKPHPCVPLPANLFGESRRNSAGLDLGDEAILRMLYLNFSREIPQQWQAFPLLAVNTEVGETRSIVNPGQRFDVVGKVTDVLVTEINAVI